MSFDRDAAVHDWRMSILSRGGLTVSEVDELQDHLEHVESGLRDSLRPEEAFWLAAHRVGTPDALTCEFSKVRPNMGWGVKAQWALLGLLAYVLVTPLAHALLYLLAAALARSPALAGAAALIRLNAHLLAIVLAITGLAFTVRTTGASPGVVDRTVSAIGSSRWSALALVGMVAWQLGAGYLAVAALSLTRDLLGRPGEPAPLQAGFWYGLSDALQYVLPALLLGAVVVIQRRLDEGGPGRG